VKAMCIQQQLGV